jgi:zinc transport system ATP-binding protein
MTPLITLEDVSFSYGGPLVLDHVTLTIYQGEFLGIVGPNGSGKSTLLKMILGLLAPTEGRVEVLGRPPAQSRTAIGYVPQFARFPRTFPITVEQTVLMGRLGKTRAIGPYRKLDKDIAGRVMDEAEILDLRHRPIGTLSGGQLERVLIARALACEPDMLLLDEPTASVDVRVEENIFGLLQRLNATVTIVVVSHDIGFISQYIERVACLNRTLVCHPTSAITGELIAQLYGAPVRAIAHNHEQDGSRRG